MYPACARVSPTGVWILSSLNWTLLPPAMRVFTRILQPSSQNKVPTMEAEGKVKVTVVPGMHPLHCLAWSASTGGWTWIDPPIGMVPIVVSVIVAVVSWSGLSVAVLNLGLIRVPVTSSGMIAAFLKE
jgi:hypothetical protein